MTAFPKKPATSAEGTKSNAHRSILTLIMTVFVSQKPRRFCYHWRKCDGRMTVHYRDRCLVVDNVTCKAVCHSKRNKRQPRLVMQGYTNRVTIQNGIATIH